MNFGKEQQIQSKESIIKIKSDINEIGNKFRDQKAKIFENLIKLRNIIKSVLRYAFRITVKRIRLRYTMDRDIPIW